MGGHSVGQKRFDNKKGIAARDRSEQRKAVSAAERGSPSGRRVQPQAQKYKPRPTATVAPKGAGDSMRRMPHGVCSGCREEGPLPPFGGGLCFLCATDGPAGEHVPAGRALDENEDGRGVLPAGPDALERAAGLSRDIKGVFRDASRAYHERSRWGGCVVSDEVAELFSELTTREGEVLDAHERLISRAKESQKDRRRFASGIEKKAAKESNDRWRARAIASGRCMYCGKERGARGTGVFCERHKSIAQLKRDLARGRGLCIMLCGRPKKKGLNPHGKEYACCSACCTYLNNRAKGKRASDRVKSGVASDTVRRRIGLGWSETDAASFPVRTKASSPLMQSLLAAIIAEGAPVRATRLRAIAAPTTKHSLVTSALSRLASYGALQRVARGVYARGEETERFVMAR